MGREIKLMITYKMPEVLSTESLNYFMKIDASCVFEDLRKNIESFLFIERKLPKYTPRYYWKTGHGYEIEIDHQMDFSIFLEEFNDEGLKHIYVGPLKVTSINERPSRTDAGIGLGAGAGATAQSVQPEEGDDMWNFIIHENVSCDGCGLEPLVGFRYKCIECRNYDLCQMCEAKHKHSEHLMMRIPNENTKPSSFSVQREKLFRLKKERKCSEKRSSRKSRKETEEEAAADQGAGGGRSSSGENRRHGRKHHKRHVRSSFFTNLYETMQDFAENSAAAAFAAANVALNAASGVGDNVINAEAAIKTPVTNATAAGSSTTNARDAGSSPSTNENSIDPKPGCSRYTNTQSKQQQSTKEQANTERKKIPPAIVSIPTKGNFTESLINFAKITADLLAYEHAVNGNGAAAASKTQSKAAASKEEEKQKSATESETEMPSTSSVAKDQNKMMNVDNIVNNKQPTSPDQMMRPVAYFNDNANQAIKDEEDLNNSTSKISIMDGVEIEPPPLILAQVASVLETSVSKPKENRIQSEKNTKDQSAGTTPSLGNSRSSSVIGDWQILDANSSYEHFEPETRPVLMGDSSDTEQLKEFPTSTQQTQTAQEPTVSTSTASTNTDTDIELEPLVIEPNRSGQVPQQSSQSQELRAVPVYHADDRINTAVLAMMSMGFSNEGAWLTQLLENVDGSIAEAIDLMSTTQGNSA